MKINLSLGAWLFLGILGGSFMIAGALHCSAPKYQITPIPTSDNAAVWKLNIQTGDLFVCATGKEEVEAGCSPKMKQL